MLIPNPIPHIPTIHIAKFPILSFTKKVIPSQRTVLKITIGKGIKKNKMTIFNNP